MTSLADDGTWYTLFERAAKAASQPNRETHHAVPSAGEPHKKPGILNILAKQLLQIPGLSRIKVEALPSTTAETAPSANYYEINELGTTNREFNLELLEWSRSKMTLLCMT
jgi:hypothetical protein